MLCVVFFKQKTAYELRISDWSSDVCSSDLFANTLGFYGVEPDPYFYLPLVGPTTLRDLAGNSIDLLVVPTAVGAPFNRTAYAVPTTVKIGKASFRERVY